MTLNSQTFDPEHPLLADRERLDQIADVMYLKVQKTFFPWTKADLSSDISRRQRILYGSGISADEVLSEAFIDLLRYPPVSAGAPHGDMGGLGAVTIARNKAVDALRASKKGLRGTDHRPQLRVVSGDAERERPDGETEPSIFELLPSSWGDPEAEYFVLQDVLKLRDLARKLLDDRDQKIFFAIHFDGYSRREVGDPLGLTSQRIGQIYSDALRRLETHPDYPFKPLLQVGQLATRRN